MLRKLYQAFTTSTDCARALWHGDNAIMTLCHCHVCAVRYPKAGYSTSPGTSCLFFWGKFLT